MANLLKNNEVLMSEYNYEKNTNLVLDRITIGSNEKIWWKCTLGHEWQATVGNRSKGSGCPYCSNYKAWTGYNDLATVNPQLASEWCYEKNVGFMPTSVTAGSHKKVWWKCNNGHEWEAEVKSRSNGTGCPYCGGKKVLKGFNDLQTVNPSLAEEWNYDKNDGLTPSDVLPSSGRKVWWKCQIGHEWETKIYYRIKGNGCPYCGGKKVLKGFNDLQTVNPSLAEEWNYDKNDGLTPSDVMPNSGKKIWWKCIKGHEWQQKIYHRNKGVNCPICYSERNTSFPEFALLYYLNKTGAEAVHSYKDWGYELDIYIPSKKIAVEYDGFYWHKNKSKQDLEKNKLCKRDGIKLYRIREGLPSLNDTSIDYVIQKNKRNELEKVIMEIVKNIMSNGVDVDLKRDSLVIENLREFIEKDNSLLLLNPKISEEWNYEKNGDLKPEYFAPNSGKIVWWKCRKEHEWQSRINSRNRGIGCPYCSGRNAVKGVNDLQTVDSTLSKEWNFEKNVGLTPSDVLPNSEIKVWWKCRNGHEWQAMIGNRTKGQGCPYCSGRKVLKGFNDLQTVMPDLAREWHLSKNRDLKPCDVTRGSNKKVWWKCLKGHEWQACVCHRSKGAGCPYCSSRKVLNGFNDLQSANPDLAKEWNYEKNSGLTPAEVTPNSRKSIWWKCSVCNYEWKTSVSNRNNQNTGCPKCSKKKTAQALSHRVIQLSLDYKVIAEYSSLMEAEKQTGISHGDISRVCSGKRRTAGGYMWKYIEQD